MLRKLARRLFGDKAEFWVTVDQGVSSGGNALTLIAAGFVLPVAAFNEYALLQFVGITTMSLSRALLAIPGMAVRRSPTSPSFDPRWLLWVVPAVWLLNFGLVAWIARGSLLQSGLLALALVFPAVQDLYRYNLIGLGRIKQVTVSDAAWVVVAVTVTGLTGMDNAIEATLAWTLGAAVALLLLAPWRKAATEEPPSLRATVRLGVFDMGGTGFNLLAGWLLFAVALAVSPSAPVAAYRLALSLIGPLMALNAAQITTIVKSASASRETWITHGLNAGTSARVKRLLVIAVPYSLFAIALAFFVLEREDDPLTNIMLAVVIASGLVRVVNTPQMATLRAAGYQRLVFLTRVVLDSCALASAAAAGFATDDATWVFIVFTVISQIAGLIVWPLVTARASRDFEGKVTES